MTATMPLIVGAGPSGLAAALFLHERGFRTRIVDAAAAPTPWSKALGINPRTLDLLAPSGVTAAILAEGQAVERVSISRNGRHIAKIAFDYAAIGAEYPLTILPQALGINPRTLDLLAPSGVTAAILAEGQAVERVCISRNGRHIATIAFDYAAIGAEYPLTILPQARTEALLDEAVARRGMQVERGVRLVEVVQDDVSVRAALVHADSRTETVQTPLLLAADGAHSTVRKAIGIGFPGDAFAETWTLADLELEGPVPGALHIDFRTNGVLAAFPISLQRWRLIALGSDVFSQLPTDWSTGTVFWRSEFQISHRLADRMSVGRIALAGDAAHIHSPIGARGMNLGIEDAWVWAACAADALNGRLERLDDYGRLRLQVDAGVVRRVRRITNAVRAQGMVANLLRRTLPPLIARTPVLRHFLLRQIAGLDHAVRVV